MFRTINVLICSKHHYKIRLRRTELAPNTSVTMQTTLAADTNLAKGQYLHVESSSVGQ
jgi:hypothetical protein